MNITLKNQSGLNYAFNVVIAAGDIEKHVERELQSYGQRVKIPGFRPGKVPMNVLKQRYGKDVQGTVLKDAIERATRDALEQKSIRPALQPDVQITSYEEGGDLTFDLTVDSLPEVPVMDYDKITIPQYTFDVDDKEVEEGLKRLTERDRHPHEAKEGTKAKLGDAVRMDFVGKMDGEAFDGGAAKDFQLELGSGQLIPGFEEQLVGKKAGDNVTVKVKFPDDYHSSTLAGKDAEFDVTINQVMWMHTPEINEEFAKKAGFESVEALKDAMREQIVANYELAARNKAKKDLFDLLDEQLTFDIPTKMVDMEFESIWQQIEQAKAKGDPSLDKPMDELRREYRAIAERRVKLGIYLSELARTNNLHVTRDELTQAVLEQARHYPGQEQKIFEFYQQNPQHVEELKGPILEEKGVDFILGKVKREQKKVAPESLFETEMSASAKKDSKKKTTAKSEKSADKPAESSEETAPKKKAAAKAPAKKSASSKD